MKQKKITLHTLLVIILVVIDQISKRHADIYLKGTDGIDLIPGVFKLYFLEGGNSGAAFGILQGQYIFFAVLTVLIIAAIMYILLRMPFNIKRFNPIRYTMLFLIAGALGNFIDRTYTYIVYGTNYVIDFLYFYLIEFPIFNVADVYVTCSAILLFVLIVFFYKEDDFSFLFKRKAKEN